MINATYPIPCRAHYLPSPWEADEDGVLDIGFCCGVLSDGRPYRLECWCMEELVMATVMFSDLGLEAYGRQEMYCLLEEEKLLQYTGQERPLQMARTHDDAANSMWALNIMLASGKNIYGKLGVRLQSYR